MLLLAIYNMDDFTGVCRRARCRCNKHPTPFVQLTLSARVEERKSSIRAREVSICEMVRMHCMCKWVVVIFLGIRQEESKGINGTNPFRGFKWRGRRE